MNKFIYHCIVLVMLVSCVKEQSKEEIVTPKNTLFTKVSSESTNIDFINQVHNEKDFNIFKYRNFYNGGGVAIGDINNDGLPDVYLTANRKENKLYLNKGDFKFEDITTSANIKGKNAWSTGVVMVDINADGLLDIYVCNAGNVEGDDQKNELFINNGDLTFTEKAAQYNLADSGFTTHAAFFDYDLDGDLDVYLLNNSFIPVSSLGYVNKRDVRAKDWNIPEILKGGGDKLLRNDKGVFTDVSEAAGIYGSLIGFGLGVTVGDVNKDLLPDIYVSNDFYERDYLYINKGDGTFNEEIKKWMSHLSISSMGADMADINNDGLPEIFVTDMLPEDDKRLKETSAFESYDVYTLKKSRDFYNQYMQNSLQLNNGDNTFSEIAFYGGVAKTDWSWGALLFDMDNDGYRDIYVSNGIYHDLTNQDFMNFFANTIIQKMTLTGKKEEVDSIINKMPSTPIPNYAFKNNGNLTFSNQTIDWGFEEPTFSNGSAYGDLDNDGDLDLIVNNFNMPVGVYQNHSEQKKNAYLKVKIKGADQNTFGIGSIVEVFSQNKIFRQELIPSRGFQSSIEYIMTIGLGTINTIDSLQVIFPNRKTLVKKDVQLNSLLTLDQKDATQEYIFPETGKGKYFEPVKQELLTHKEDAYVDFDFEGLLYKMQSREGPAMAIGDVNNDGNDDVYIGGAYGQVGKVYLQSHDGKLKPTKFETEDFFEDTVAVFEDIDGDKDLDLIIGSGGNFKGARTGVRSYVNDGKGIFSRGSIILPTQTNIAALASNDYDQDGDIDIFVGSQSVIGMYGVSPNSYLLENDGKGNFRDVTKNKATAIGTIGMITDAIWQDIDNDKIKDLIVVGEWMSPKVFKNTKEKLISFNTNLDSISGWFNTVEAKDLDKDGDIDIILGNRGLNAMYQADNENPVKMYIHDFDSNGTIEQVFTQTIDGRDIPIHLRNELTGQINVLKKQNLKFSEYATKAIDELFSPEVLQNATVKSVNNFASLIAYNDGQGNFEIKTLPDEVQISCICDIETEDLNNDGVLDLIVAGNNYSFKPQFSRLDASTGNILLSTSNGEYIDQKASGFFVEGEVKELHWLKNKSGEKYLISGINNKTPKIFKLKK
ncbi:CRTAC1 family protein [Aquimarina sp. AD10]|uniref:VCBS repeat-containing protein n=1 Tax=Aquimarina sp. AD10 TaxID=1714849 RepID=UPI000E481B33|nr:VCBS repeat-containing protein [Aquimarina sp. AD10]AXT62553.1 CRTAC1 family protein [Aquimarina sp. AD10]RKM97737.1 CRTAC1 family protein [Aquimarina sp. AD10]